MEKSKILAIGCGGCGGRQLDVLMDYDSRYTGIFMNTNLSEMETLNHFDRERRCFYISNSDGTGKNRELAERYIKEEAPKFAEMIKKFVGQPYILMLTSANGGTGSKSVIMLSKLVKKLCPEKSINLVITFPSLNENDIDFENAIDFWNELIEIKSKGIIDSIQFIDNNKSTNEEDINIRAMKELDDGFNIIGGKLDSSDATRIHTSKGYKVVLKLDKNTENLEESISKAKISSVFFVPHNLECDVAIGNINIENITVKSVKREIDIYDFSKFNEYEKGDSVIALGGCQIPKEPVELAKEALKEIKNKKRSRVIDDDLIVRKKIEDKEEVTTNTIQSKSSKLSSADLTKMFQDDSFWK
jgi:hypothetical protein